jgi:hypothetical protein
VIAPEVRESCPTLYRVFSIFGEQFLASDSLARESSRTVGPKVLKVGSGVGSGVGGGDGTPVVRLRLTVGAGVPSRTVGPKVLNVGSGVGSGVGQR